MKMSSLSIIFKSGLEILVRLELIYYHKDLLGFPRYYFHPFVISLRFSNVLYFDCVFLVIRNICFCYKSLCYITFFSEWIVIVTISILWIITIVILCLFWTCPFSKFCKNFLFFLWTSLPHFNNDNQTFSV